MNIKQFQKYADEFAKKLKPRSLILLSGDLAAGKTEFVKSVVNALGGEDISSPTFALHHRYQLKANTIEHWDLYRLKSEEDLESAGFWDQFSDPNFIIFVEWPERLNVLHLPRDINLIKIQIHIISDTERKIIIS